jgi:hypothetical protein
MGQTREAVTQNLAERLCWQAARRDDARVARCLYRKEVIDGVYRLDEGALLMTSSSACGSWGSSSEWKASRARPCHARWCRLYSTLCSMG